MDLSRLQLLDARSHHESLTRAEVRTYIRTLLHDTIAFFPLPPPPLPFLFFPAHLLSSFFFLSHLPSIPFLAYLTFQSCPFFCPSLSCLLSCSSYPYLSLPLSFLLFVNILPSLLLLLMLAHKTSFTAFPPFFLQVSYQSNIDRLSQSLHHFISYSS